MQTGRYSVERIRDGMDGVAFQRKAASGAHGGCACNFDRPFGVGYAATPEDIVLAAAIHANLSPNQVIVRRLSERWRPDYVQDRQPWRAMYPLNSSAFGFAQDGDDPRRI